MYRRIEMRLITADEARRITSKDRLEIIKEFYNERQNNNSSHNRIETEEGLISELKRLMEYAKKI